MVSEDRDQTDTRCMWCDRSGISGWQLYGRGFPERAGIDRTDPEGVGDQPWHEPSTDISICDPATGNFRQRACICGKCDLLLKETSVFSAISLMDLMFTAKDLIGLYYKTTESLFLLVVFYLIILLPVSILGTLLERRLRYAGFGD